MRKIIVIVVFAISFSIAFSGCYYDKQDLVYPTTTCDTTNMTYATSIENIMKANCYSCHAGDATGASGIALDSYARLKARANSGQLITRITSNDPSVMMPKGGPKLSACDIAKMSAWVSHGAPQ